MSLFDFIFAALSPYHFMLGLSGVVVGTVVGALPGLTATMAIAVLVPFTFAMDPTSALILMGAIYTGAMYGGAYSAILLNTPGTPSAIATTFEGYPMARRGDGDLAITVACLSSVVGGLVGALFLLMLAPPLAEFALEFGPTEYFWLAMFGLTLIASLSEGNLLKGLIGACLGLLIACIGVAEISSDMRFTFGVDVLVGGIETISALIGLYCIPVLIDLVATPARHLQVHETRGFRLDESVALTLRHWFVVLRSSVIGTVVGILPGAGGSIASLVAYSETRRTSKRGKHFGTGEPEGIMSSESANNATVGGGLIPTLVLGIPGTPTDAVILGALLVQGVRTGPGLFTEGGGSIIYTFIAGLFIATILMLPAGLLIGRYAYKSIITVPKALLVPTVAFLTIIGTYAIRNSVSDVVIMIVLGVFGWILNRFGFTASPIVLGLILSRIAEQGFVQGWIIGEAAGNPLAGFFTRPISFGLLVMVLLTLFYPVLKPHLLRLLNRGERNS